MARKFTNLKYSFGFCHITKCAADYAFLNINKIFECCIYIFTMQGDSRGKFNILGGNRFGHCEKKVHMSIGTILKVYRDRSV